MKMPFTKYQATGNDFVLVDNRQGNIKLSIEEIQRICSRKFGIGADGLILIDKHPVLDFDLVYYNSDGSPSLCGNGCRAAVKMASSLGIVNGKAQFNAFDGQHNAEIFPDGIVKLKMNDVREVKKIADDWFIYTGSPHLIRLVKNLTDFPVVEEGRKLRYSEAFKPGGTNVNFVELMDDNTIFVRTYERGVEDETLSCGTGVTAAAMAVSFVGYTSPVSIKSLGGDLKVEFKSGLPVSQSVAFHDIFLIGPAKMVFEGELEL